MMASLVAYINMTMKINTIADSSRLQQRSGEQMQVVNLFPSSRVFIFKKFNVRWKYEIVKKNCMKSQIVKYFFGTHIHILKRKIIWKISNMRFKKKYKKENFQKNRFWGNGSKKNFVK